MFGERVEHVLVDHVAAGVVKTGTLGLLFSIGKDREFHVNTRNMAEHLFEFNLLGVHEERVRDLCRAEFLALAAVHTGVGNVGEPDQVEHEVRGQLTGSHIRRVLCCAVHTVADRAGLDTGITLDAAGSLAHDLL